MTARRFRQVDVFTTGRYRGNPVAVVLDGEGLSDAEMQRFAHWTNLSETTFVRPPTEPGADYLVRIFTPAEELPFAGHPTLGTCHAWLEAGGVPKADTIVQQCEAGLVPLRRTEPGLAFAAPPLLREGPVEEAEAVEVAAALGVDRAAIVDLQWADNGPGWVAVLLADADAVLALRPGRLGDQKIGVAGPYPPGSPCAYEVRAFFPLAGLPVEDPVTGSLNASLAQWLYASGRASGPYVASQGAALGRAGRVHVSRDPDGTVWVGGGSVTCVTGSVDL